jgi:hypothetical protein
MESSTAIQSSPMPLPSEPDKGPTPRKQRHLLLRVLDVVASLRITVVLFALSLVLVFYGTWAQVDRGIWDVVHDYFRNKTIVWIPLKVLFFFRLPPEWSLNEVRIPYPGGQLLGGLLLINLIAAHIVRLKLSWKRAGILILHAGIILMMLGEYFTGEYAVEGMMTIGVGEKTNFVQDNRTHEIAVADVTNSSRTQDDVVAIYMPAIKKRHIRHDDLPFDIEVLEFMPNSLPPRTRKQGEPEQAANGKAKGMFAKEVPIGNGVDANQRVDTPAAIVKLKSKDGKADLGTYLLSYYIDPGDRVSVGDKVYEIALRPKRTYRDYTVYLEKAEERKHPNLEMAKDYSSYIVLDDPKNGVHDMKVRIYMNNPLRYRGEAFFQANMSTASNGELITGLQVVRNEVWSFPVWILPYLSCVVVAIGMLLHFGVNLVGFLQAQTRNIR